MRGNGIVYIDTNSLLHAYYNSGPSASLDHCQLQFRGYTHHEGLYQRAS